MANQDYEVLVIGGGPAGLSATLYLARYDRHVILFDAGHGRSSWQQVNYNYLGFPNGIRARDLRRLGREQVERYGHVSVVEERIDCLAREDGLFAAYTVDRQQVWRAPAAILCTGVIDYWPRFPGWEAYVGRSMFWCITCDGYSSRGMRLVVVGNDDDAAVTTRQLKRFTGDIRLLTNDEDCRISEAERRRLSEAGIPLICDRIASAEGEDGQFRALTTVGGQRIKLDRLFNQQGAEPRVKLALDLGVELDTDGYIRVDEEQKTSVAGVYAAGDVDGRHSHQIAAAVHEGGQAASAANYYLYPPELQHL